MPARFRTLLLVGLAGAMLAPTPAAARAEEPIARFEDPLCPGVLGLQRDAAEMVVSRIRANAEALGLDMADEEACEANLVVAFVEDGHEFLSRLRDRRSYLFTEMSHEEREELMAETGPVRAFLRVRSRSRGCWRTKAWDMSWPARTLLGRLATTRRPLCELSKR